MVLPYLLATILRASLQATAMSQKVYIDRAFAAGASD
jgi:hypothetical protein